MMQYAQAMRELLEPLGIYRLERGTLSGGELDALGAALDERGRELEEIQREMLLTTAEDSGLEAIEQLLVHRPVAADLEHRRAALAALLRIGGDSFTLTAINDNLRGCGLNAVASETAVPGVVEVRFPEVPGIPEGFEAMRTIMEEIIPCHLEVKYVYWYVVWEELERKLPTWRAIEDRHPSWYGMETMV